MQETINLLVIIQACNIRDFFCYFIPKIVKIGIICVYLQRKNIKIGTI